VVLGAAVRSFRELRGFTQEELTDRARLSKNTVGNIERGDSAPTFPVLVAVSEALGLPLSELIHAYEDRLSSS